MLFLTVDYRGAICIDEINHSKDFCVDKAIEKELIKQIRCTTPYGPQKNQICKNKDDSFAAQKFYTKNLPGTSIFKNMAWQSSNTTKQCYNPCKIFTFMTRSFEKYKKSRTKSYSSVLIYFEENIKVTRDYYIYTKINLIAEIGGYVGLFLGVSVNQLTNLIDFIVAKVKQMHHYIILNTKHPIRSFK